MNALELSGIVKRFGAVTALEGVSLSLAPGEVLALVGENGAGKSTLVSIACGLYRPDAGAVHAFGRELPPGDPRVAIEAGIGVVYQHFMLVGPLTVWENAVLGREPRRLGCIDRRRSREEIAAVARKAGLALDVDAPVETLSVAAQQRVEIVKQLWRGARVLILDEPTAVLTPQESAELIATLRALAGAGRSVLFISHKLKEVLAVADRVAVIRRGRILRMTSRAGTDAAALSELVVGGRSEAAPPSRAAPLDAIALQVRNLTCASDRGSIAVRGVSFEVRRAETVGIAGIDGNGQIELAEAIAGLRPARGLLSLDGDRAYHRTPKSARAAGVAHVPEDRRHALCPPLSVEENLSLGHHFAPPWARGPLIDRPGRRARAQELMAAFDVRAPGPLARAGDLSGGNQQKLVLARELAGGREPRLVIAVHPTRGLDPGATRRVHQALSTARERGAAVLIVSLDLDELRALCDRILVMFDGRIAGAAAKDATDEQLGRMMLGQVSAVA